MLLAYGRCLGNRVIPKCLKPLMSMFLTLEIEKNVIFSTKNDLL